MIKFIKKAAFTLAEVLIVLGIVGIVAECTIPTLVMNFEDQVATTKLKKCFQFYLAHIHLQRWRMVLQTLGA